MNYKCVLLILLAFENDKYTAEASKKKFWVEVF